MALSLAQSQPSTARSRQAVSLAGPLAKFCPSPFSPDPRLQQSASGVHLAFALASRTCRAVSMLPLCQLHLGVGPPRQSRPRRAPCAASRAVVAQAQQDALQFQQLAASAEAEVLVRAGETPLGRGLVTMEDIENRQALVSVPVHNALVVTDEPENISIFGDRQHRLWQERHGQLPEQLVEFLQGESRWDVRLSAWLLWVCRQGSAHGPLWQKYHALLPAEEDMSCLLNYSPQEMTALQLPSLQTEAVAQREWATYLHSKYFDEQRGDLATLRLSRSLADTTWAVAMVRSRTFSEDVNGELVTLMVPFSDLANHSFENNATFAMATNNRSFLISSLQHIAAGSEATISYGADKPNSELLRDYGFVVPGNPNDRLLLPPVGKGPDAFPRLNGASLLQATGFTGNLAEGDVRPIGPGSSNNGTDAATTALHLARRRSALLSIPVVGAKGLAEGTSARDLFAWPPSAWTPSGSPEPQPLQPSQVAAERTTVARVAEVLRVQLGSLPTSLQSDQDMLAALGKGGAVLGAVESSSGGGGGGSSRQSGGKEGGSRSTLPRGARSRAQQSSSQSSALQTGQPFAAPARLETALRARIEAKLLLHEGLQVLAGYDRHLADMTG